jgi:hypothetical protein
MSDAIQAAPSARDSMFDKTTDAQVSETAEPTTPPKDTRNAPSLDVNALTDRTLHFLATASNETLGACLVGLGAGTYLILGRVGLVLIGVVGGVVLHATWEGHGQDGDDNEKKGKSAEARRRELGVDVAHRVLDWRDSRTQEGKREDDASDLSLKLYSGTPLDFAEFKPETAAALTELTDAVIRDYVKYVLRTIYRGLSNGTQVVVFARPARRRRLSRLVPPDLHCPPPLRVCTPLTQATRR